jgi:dTDP-4-amino-4,6-dideoxygalactose transaminase
MVGALRYLPTDATLPLCDLERQARALEPELLEAAGRVLRSGRYILGPEGDAFAVEVAKYLGVRHAIGVANGTDALTLALLAVGVGPGDRVLTSPFTFFGTAEAIIRAGAEPVFADIDPETYNVDADTVAAALPRIGATPPIKAIVPVHLFGQSADSEGIRALADSNDLPVVEDAAQAMGAHGQGRRAGTVGHVGCFSFFPSKNLGALGDGGLVTTDDDGLAASVARLRVHGASGPNVHETAGLNSRLDELQAAFLRVKLPRLGAWVDRRRSHAAAYGEALAGVPDLRLPEDRTGGGHAYHQYTVRVGREHRDALRRHLAAEGIATAIYYPCPLHLQPALRHLGYHRGDFPVAEAASASVLSLPMFPELRPTEIERVAWAMRAFRP